jgi:molybdopterin converting factor small subunit
MKVTLELTYDMSKALGADALELENVRTVADVVEQAKRRLGPDFDKHARLAGIAVNGVLISYKKGLKTKLADGDIVAFVKASAGG